MASYTLPPIVFTAEQEVGLDRMLFERNTQRMNNNEPFLTKLQYLTELAQAWPVQFANGFRQDFLQRLNIPLQTASNNTLIAIANGVGMPINPYSGNPVRPEGQSAQPSAMPSLSATTVEEVEKVIEAAPPDVRKTMIERMRNLWKKS